MRKVANFEELKQEFKNYLGRGKRATKLIVYLTPEDSDARENLLIDFTMNDTYMHSDDYIKYIKKLVKHSWVLSPKSTETVCIAGEKRMKEGKRRLYFMNGRRYAYFDVYRESQTNKEPQNVKLRKLLLKLPKMPLREYFSRIKDIWDMTGEMNVVLETLHLVYMGEGDTRKIAPFYYATEQLGVINRPQEIIFD